VAESRQLERAVHGAEPLDAEAAQAYAVIGARGDLRAREMEVHRHTAESVMRREQLLDSSVEGVLQQRTQKRAAESGTTKPTLTVGPMTVAKAMRASEATTSTRGPAARGPPGPKGVQGEQGVRGKRGSQGSKGEAGTRGLPGHHGLAGPAGPKGKAGKKGPPGPEGDKGDKGKQPPTPDIPKGYGKTTVLGAIMVLHVVMLLGMYAILSAKSSDLKKKKKEAEEAALQEEYEQWEEEEWEDGEDHDATADGGEALPSPAAGAAAQPAS